MWQALIDPIVIVKWGGGPAKMTDIEGQKFSLWGGQVHGTNKEVEKNKKLFQEWWGGRWDEPSQVTFLLSEKNGVTTVKLLHDNVPDSEEIDLKDGWHSYYLGPLKKLLEK